MPSFCAAINCSNVQRKGTNLSFFRFPKDSARCRRWVINCRRADLDKKSCDELHKNYYLCAKHFEDNQFTNILHKWLIWTAIPTIFYVSNPPLQITSKHRLPVRHSFPDVATATNVLTTEMSPDAHQSSSATKVNSAQTLYEIILPNCDFGFLYVRHPEHALYLSDKIVKMYITMRLFYAVKFKNRELLNSQSKKQVL